MGAFRQFLRDARNKYNSKRAFNEYCRFGCECPLLLIDTPEHGNLGDQAIALAERGLLNEWFGPSSYFEMTAEQIDGLEQEISRLAPMDQVVLVHGGGFLGTLWPNEEYRFRRILEAFVDNRVVVFPQTATFDFNTDDGHAFFDDSRRAYSMHRNLTVCCRERNSLNMMRNMFPDVRTELIPDVVLSLHIPELHEERSCILFCLRGDRERRLNECDSNSLLNAARYAYPDAPVRVTDTMAPRRVTPGKCEQAVKDKLREFAQAHLVVTDRLHGMVFAAITGTPCVALNNSNGKVEGVYEWISDLSYIAFARSADEATALIEGGRLAPGVFPVARYRALLSRLRELVAQDSGLQCDVNKSG